MMNRENLIDFFPIYPNITDEDFNQSIYNKQEFNEFKLEPTEDRPEPGESYNHQKIVKNFISGKNDFNELVLYHNMGTGKCHGKGTPILLYTGEIKNVEDIKVGDQLMGDDSTPRTVTSLARGSDEMYDIINRSKGESYNVNSEHILCLKPSSFPYICYSNYKKNHSYNVQWVENNKFQSKTFTFKQDESNKEEMKEKAIKFKESIKCEQVLEIEVKDFLKLSKGKRELLKGYKTGVDFEEKELPIDPYMIGYWLGDGTACRTEITSQDSSVLHYFRNNLARYGLSLNFRSNYSYDINGFVGTKGSNRFLNILKDLSLLKNKHIPYIYKCNSRENRLKLLAGLIDSDGNRNVNSYEFSQKNEKLMDDVIYLCRSLGFSCFKKKKKTSWVYKGVKKYGEVFRININGNGIDEIPVLIPRKKVGSRKINKDALVNTIDVVHTGFDDYYGFTIDGNERYILGDFTVTHNTCSSVGIAENLIKNNAIRRVYVISRGENLARSFQKELATTCTNNKYSPTNFEERGGTFYQDGEEITTSQFFIRIKKAFSHHYTFDTYIKFAKTLKNTSTSDLVRKYSNCLFILDEVHNMREQDDVEEGLDVYNEFKRMFDVVSYRKILLLSGTPMVDQPNEIAGIMNLILRNQTMPIGQTFDRRYLERTGNYYNVKENRQAELGRFFKGRISYLKAMTSNVQIDYEGEVLRPMRYFKVYPSTMHQHQARQYLLMLNQESGVFTNSRKATLYVDPTEYLRELGESSNKMNVVKKYSTKYHEFIKAIEERPRENVFAFQFFVSNPVNTIHFYVLGSTLSAFGYNELKPREGMKISNLRPAKRYAKITSRTSPQETRIIEKIYNDPLNRNGEYLRIVIGSESISEGLSFKNVQQIHILTPFWNYAKVEQAIFRGIRLNSHLDLENPHVRIYQHCAILPDRVNMYEEDMDQAIDDMFEDDEELNEMISNGLSTQIEEEINDDDFLNDEIQNNIGPEDEEEGENLIPNDRIPNRYEKSIDLYMYDLSEIKDYSIKQVDRIIMKNAFDCQLFFDRNYNPNNTNDTRTCQYQECLYSCVGINPERFILDKSSYQLYYREDYLKKIVEFLKVFFNTNFIITFDRFFELIEDETGNSVDTFQLLSVLSVIITNNVIFLNKFGLRSYVRTYKNTIFLVSNIRNTDTFMELYYNKMVLLQQEIIFGEYIAKLQLQENIDIFMNIVNGDDNTRRQEIIKLKALQQSQILETAYISQQNNNLKDWIINYYGPYTFRLSNGTIVHNILKTAQIGDIRCLNQETRLWFDCETEENIAEINQIIATRFANQTNYYGIYNPVQNIIRSSTARMIDGLPFYEENFKLRDISRPERLTQNTGISCKTAFKKQLIPIILSMDTFTESDLRQKLGVGSANKERLLSKFTPDLLKKIEMKRPDLNNFTTYNLLKLLYYGPQSKGDICQDIYKYFKSKDLLVVDINKK